MTSNKLFCLVFMVLVAGFVWWVPGPTPSSKAPNLFSSANITITDRGQSHQFQVAIADHPKAHQQGLMHRKHWKELEGMLFVFDQTRMQSFWMKNTYLPLDILFFNQQGKLVHMVANTTPMDQTLLPSKYPAKYVLEIPAGDTKKRGIELGATLDLPALNGSQP